MALVSKLRSVPDQLPDRTINILFIFHSGYGENHKYIQQSLFGDGAFFGDPHSVRIGDGALFAEIAWSKISAVAYVGDCAGALHCYELWRNPRASMALPDVLKGTISDLT
jgi:hypothetical protein